MAGNLDKSLIEYLSNEISTHSLNTMTFRSRLSFVVLIGPFALLGSFMIASEGAIPDMALDGMSLVLLGLAAICYLAMAYFAGVLDRHMTDQTNRWRGQIVRLANDKRLDPKAVLFPHSKTPWLYVLCFVLSLGAFTCVTVASYHALHRSTSDAPQTLQAISETAPSAASEAPDG